MLVIKNIALIKAIKSNCFVQKMFISFYKPQFQTVPTKNSKNDKKKRKIVKHWAQKPLK